MIVSEKNISDALIYLADDPHPVAGAKFRLTMAENLAREAYAHAFINAEGPVKERECLAETSEHVIKSRRDEADALLEYERHRSRVKAAEMLLEIWRTENANARAAERIR